MPRKMELALMRYARKVGAKPGSKRYDRIVYGTMNKRGMLHKGKTRKRGKRR